MVESWKRVSSREVHSNRWKTYLEDEVILPSGEQIPFTYVKLRDFVQVIAVGAENETYLVQQYRYPAGESNWELPGGFIDEGETPAQAAQRELEEEAGVSATKIKVLGKLEVLPGLTNQRCYICLATELTLVERHLEQTEQGMNLMKISLPELRRRIKLGEIRNMPTIAAFALLQWQEK